MKYCQHCGSEIMDEAVICPKCGCSVAAITTINNVNINRSNGFAIAGFICSFFIAILGFIFGGIGLSKSKELGGSGKGLSIAALIISGISVLRYVIIYMIFVLAITGSALG